MLRYVGHDEVIDNTLNHEPHNIYINNAIEFDLGDLDWPDSRYIIITIDNIIL